MNNLFKKAELLANIAIVIVALVLGVVLVKRYLLPNSQSKPIATERQIIAGTKLTMEGVDWAKNKRTLLLALSTSCHFCTESAPFYRRLAAERAKSANIKLVAVLPQELSESQRYLSEQGIVVDDVREAIPSVLGAAGTPTLIMADGAGIVAKSWVGKLPPEKEAEVLKSFQ